MLDDQDLDQTVQLQAVIHPGCSSSTLFLADVTEYFESMLVTHFSIIVVIPWDPTSWLQ